MMKKKLNAKPTKLVLVLLAVAAAAALLHGGWPVVRGRVTQLLSTAAGPLHGHVAGSVSDSGTGSPSDDPATLAVAQPEPMTGYSRAKFGPAWTDDVDVEGGHNGCDTRDDILRRDMTSISTANRCVVLGGTLADPYTGQVIRFHRGQETSSQVQIDHVVPLGNAWVSGAENWPLERREQIANDPLNLLAVDGKTNMSKGDKNAAQWLPPNQSFRCVYVKTQVEVKNKYRLTVTSAEKKVMESFYGKC